MIGKRHCVPRAICGASMRVYFLAAPRRRAICLPVGSPLLEYVASAFATGLTARVRRWFFSFAS